MTEGTCTLSNLSEFKNLNLSELITLVKRGLSAVIFGQVANCLQVSERQLAGVLNISVSTLTRRKREGKLTQTESEHVLRMIRIFNKALDVFETEERARDWMHTKVAALGDLTPIEFADTEVGAREVENILVRIDHGVYS